jgi:hypothetical protein
MHPNTIGELGALHQRDLDIEAARNALADSLKRNAADTAPRPRHRLSRFWAEVRATFSRRIPRRHPASQPHGLPAIVETSGADAS